MCIVPTHHIQIIVKVEHIIREGANSGQNKVLLHQVLINIKPETILSPDCFIKATKNHYCLIINRHTHGQITSVPTRLRVETNHSPHVMVDVVHLNCVSDFFLVEFGPTTKHIDVFVVEDAACG